MVTELVRLGSDSVPARFRVCGLPGALSLMFRARSGEGDVNDATGAGRDYRLAVIVCAKAPITRMLLICNGMEPVLESVTL